MEQERKVILSWIILIFSSPTTGQQIQSTASIPGPTTISPTTGPQRPSAPPANVSGHNTSSTSIFVQWDQVPAAHQNGAILYYTVTYRALPSGSVQTDNVPAPANQMTLTGLNKYTNYSITVFASTSRGAGNVSAPIFIVTDEDRPSAPPANVSGYSTSSTTIFVQWDQVPAADQNGVILYYTITYGSYCSGNFSIVIVAAPTTQTTLTGLNQGTLYSISESAFTIKEDITGPFLSMSIATEKLSTTATTEKTESTTCYKPWIPIYLTVG